MGKSRAKHPTVADEVVFRKEPGGKITLLFDDEAGLLEIRVSPLETGEFDPESWLVPHAPEYIAKARSVLALARGDGVGAMRALRVTNKPRLGLSSEFLGMVAAWYEKLVAGGESAPVKAMGELHGVDISTASRWIKAARQRGFISG